MNNEEKILTMLEEMRGDIANLKATQAQQGAALMAVQDAQARQSAALMAVQDTVTRVAVTQEGVVIPRIQTALEGYSELNRKLNTLATKEQVQALSSDVDVIKAVVTRHSEDIGKLKKAQ